MQIEDLVDKISNSIDELGKIFDQIHKVPFRLREKHFENIQRLKDKLIGLKTGLKQANLFATQKNFKQVSLAIHRLRNEIADQISLNLQKQNRDANRPNLKETRRNHEDAMNLIVEKDKKIQQLSMVLYQKQELIKLAFEDIRKFKKSSQQYSEQYKSVKLALNQLQIEYSSIKSVLIKTEEANIDIALKDQQRDRHFREILEEIQILKHNLLIAQDKIRYFEELAETSLQKSKLVEENMKIIEAQAHSLKQNFQRKEAEGLKKDKQIQEAEIKIKNYQNRQLQLEQKIARSQQQINQLQFQLHKVQNFVHEQRSADYDLRSQKQKQINQLEQDLLKNQKYAEELFGKFQHLEEKIAESQGIRDQKEKDVRRLKEQLIQSQQKAQEYLLMTANLSQQKEKYFTELKILRKEKELYNQQLQKSIEFSKQLQNDIKNYKQMVKVKQQQKVKVILEIQKIQREVKIFERNQNINQKSLQALKNQAIQSRTYAVKLQQKLKIKQRQIEGLKMRFMRAKIEIIQEIRQDLN